MQQQQSTQFQKPMQDVIHSQMVKAGGKVYFFDVKKASNGNNYLTIAESYKKPSGEKVTNRFLIFNDYFQEFAGALNEMQKYLK